MRKSKRTENAKSGSRSPDEIASMINQYADSESDKSSVKSQRKKEVDFLWTRILSLTYRNIDSTTNYSFIKDKEDNEKGYESEQGSG